MKMVVGAGYFTHDFGARGRREDRLKRACQLLQQLISRTKLVNSNKGLRRVGENEGKVLCCFDTKPLYGEMRACSKQQTDWGGFRKEAGFERAKSLVTYLLGIILGVERFEIHVLHER